jgi:DNA-binding PadR family transcriptional regulator
MLGTLERHVMLAILRENGNAYGVSIADTLEKRTGRRHSLGAIYTTLDRLYEKKYLTKRDGEPTKERGGRRKMYYALTGLGQGALDEALNETRALGRGIPRPRGAVT